MEATPSADNPSEDLAAEGQIIRRGGFGCAGGIGFNPQPPPQENSVISIQNTTTITPISWGHMEVTIDGNHRRPHVYVQRLQGLARQRKGVGLEVMILSRGMQLILQTCPTS